MSLNRLLAIVAAHPGATSRQLAALTGIEAKRLSARLTACHRSRPARLSRLVVHDLAGNPPTIHWYLPHLMPRPFARPAAPAPTPADDARADLADRLVDVRASLTDCAAQLRESAAQLRESYHALVIALLTALRSYAACVPSGHPRLIRLSRRLVRLTDWIIGFPQAAH